MGSITPKLTKGNRPTFTTSKPFLSPGSPTVRPQGAGRPGALLSSFISDLTAPSSQAKPQKSTAEAIPSIATEDLQIKEDGLGQERVSEKRSKAKRKRANLRRINLDDTDDFSSILGN